MAKYVVGHQNPDTDSICAALTYANLKQELGEDYQAVRIGKINAETEYVLERYGVEAPELIEAVTEDDKVVLVDHNELSQAVTGIETAEITGIIDHHRIGGIETGNPIYFRNEPVGCSCTIVAKIYQEQGIEIADEIAALLLSAILSDTVIFRSPTCTEDDKRIAKQLAKQLDVEIEEYGKELFKAGSVVNKLSPEELIQNDYKEYEFAGETIGVGQIEVMDVEVVKPIKDELLTAAQNLVEKNNYQFLVLMVTDILEEASLVLFTDRAKEFIEGGFEADVKANEVYLPGVLSRKKQVIPVLSKVIANNS